VKCKTASENNETIMLEVSQEKATMSVWLCAMHGRLQKR